MALECFQSYKIDALCRPLFGRRGKPCRKRGAFAAGGKRKERDRVKSAWGEERRARISKDREHKKEGREDLAGVYYEKP